MNKRTMMIFLVVLATLAGFVMANNILGTRIRTITVRDGDSFYVEPSVTAMSATSLFQVGEELLVELAVPKDAAVPVDEGTWLLLRKKDDKSEAWQRSKTQWY